MDWKKVNDYFIVEFIPKMKYPNKGKEWLIRVETSETAKLLCINIMIDIMSGSIDQTTYVDVFDSMDIEITDPCLSFTKALDKMENKEDLVCSSKLVCSDLERGDYYLRTMELKDFIDYYIGKVDGLSSCCKDDVKIARARYFNKSTTLEKVYQWMRGKSMSVFITSNKDLSNKIMKYAKEEHATIINDVYGLGYTVGVGKRDMPEFIAIEYPPEFQLKCYQPTTIDGWMGEKINGYYISNTISDGWGQAHCLSNKMESGKERVHAYFKGLTKHFKTRHIGISNKISVDKSMIITAASERLKTLYP